MVGDTGRDRRSGSDSLSVGRTWLGVHWLRTDQPIRTWQRGFQDRRDVYKVGVTIP